MSLTTLTQPALERGAQKSRKQILTEVDVRLSLCDLEWGKGDVFKGMRCVVSHGNHDPAKRTPTHSSHDGTADILQVEERHDSLNVRGTVRGRCTEKKLEGKKRGTSSKIYWAT